MSTLSPLGRLTASARSYDLGQRAEAAVDSARAEAARERLRAEAEEAAREVAQGVAEVRVVEDVKDFGAQLQAHALRERELSSQSEVELREPEAAQGVAAERALLAGRAEGSGLSRRPPGASGSST